LTLLGRLAVPLHRFGFVLRHASALLVHEAEEGLPFCVSLIGRLAVALSGLGVVPRHALALGVHHAEEGLRVGVALICKGLT
jgi:hypothetical protein